MSKPDTYSIHRLTSSDREHFYCMLDLFGTVFEDPESYCAKPPEWSYIQRLVDSQQFFAFVALDDSKVVGAIAGYELLKFEQCRSEFYIYDLGVSESHRRQGIASALIEATQSLARAKGSGVVYVQAGYEDEPAVALYSKLGQRAEVLHFDFPLSS